MFRWLRDVTTISHIEDIIELLPHYNEKPKTIHELWSGITGNGKYAATYFPENDEIERCLKVIQDEHYAYPQWFWTFDINTKQITEDVGWVLAKGANRDFVRSWCRGR